MTTLLQIETSLEAGLLFVQKVAPLAALGGPAAAAIGATVAQVAGIAATILPQIETDADIIGSGDVTRIRQLQAQLEAENAALNAKVAAS